MRIVITRPKEKAFCTSEKIKKMDHTPIMMPLSYFTHDKEAVKIACQQPYAAIAITSSEAIKTLPPNVSHHTPIFASGEKSALIAQKKGFYNIFHGIGHSIDLAQKIIQQKKIFKSKIPLLYLAGKSRNTYFENYMIEHQIPIRIIECYSTWSITYTKNDVKKSLQNADAILFYAKSAVSRFFLLPSYIKKSAYLFCLSHNIAKEIPESCKNKVFISNLPKESSILELLKDNI
ncbi:Uroporphyrinogen-III synthase [Candidatus Liberibacter americanus str. Sao Paulo]|uniref:Uroporphyrinogen-III synthase n=2 Tax=Candidatus Liberibacter americanus TaxID=309868 RepID=U6B8Q2_9HYPH|nr:Uroporphyrinogen-III synthase [Candidatus Liberibacter americanus str. Sao Paulo]EMS36026.1 uroporphyrinogen-III synthase [Candidatus Liberibacter americanus PW_SP]